MNLKSTKCVKSHYYRMKDSKWKLRFRARESSIWGAIRNERKKLHRRGNNILLEPFGWRQKIEENIAKNVKYVIEFALRTAVSIMWIKKTIISRDLRHYWMEEISINKNNYFAWSNTTSLISLLNSS
jgi:hypothetical protein